MQEQKIEDQTQLLIEGQVKFQVQPNPQQQCQPQIHLQNQPQAQPNPQFQNNVQFQNNPQFQYNPQFPNNPQFQPIAQYQQYQIQGAQQNPNIVIVDDSNFCSKMCCVLTWLILVIISTCASIFFLQGYYLYLNIIFLIAALLIVISICTKNLNIYKIGYVFYFIYTILICFLDLMIILGIWSNMNDLIKFLGIFVYLDYMTVEDKSSVEKSLNIWRIVLTVTYFTQMTILSAILRCLKEKMLVFKAYENYINRLKIAVNQQANVV